MTVRQTKEQTVEKMVEQITQMEQVVRQINQRHKANEELTVQIKETESEFIIDRLYEVRDMNEAEIRSLEKQREELVKRQAAGYIAETLTDAISPLRHGMWKEGEVTDTFEVVDNLGGRYMVTVKAIELTEEHGL